MFAWAGLREKGVERVIRDTNTVIRWHLTIRMYSMLKAIQLPARISHLHTSLANVDWNNLPHFYLDVYYNKYQIQNEVMESIYLEI